MGDKKVDEAVRDRLTEILAAAGVSSSRAALEVLYYLPRDFVDLYAQLFDGALKLNSKNGADLKDDAELGKAPTKGGRTAELKGRGAKTNGKRYKNHWVIRDETKLELKKSLDKKLRRITRELREDLDDLEVLQAGGKVSDKCRCGRCGMLMNRDWNFCPSCGQNAPIEVAETKLPRKGRD